VQTQNDPTIIIGIVKHQEKLHGVLSHWRTNNGILIAGQSGSGKSQTAAFILNQYAALGVGLIICDYDSPDANEETLSSRVAHLSESFYLPPVKSEVDIQARLQILDAEHRLRLTNPDRRFPLMLVIDEVSAFLSFLSETKKKGEDPIKRFSQNLLQLRKQNIRVMIIGQEWSSGFATSTLRIIRSAFTVKLVHRLDRANVSLVLDRAESDTIRTISKLRTGQLYFNGATLSVPLLDKTQRDWAIARMQDYTFHRGGYTNTTISQPIVYTLPKNEMKLRDIRS